MHPFTTEDISLEAPPRSLWRALRDLAISVAVVGTVALLATFFGPTPVHAQNSNELRTDTGRSLLQRHVVALVKSTEVSIAKR